MSMVSKNLVAALLCCWIFSQGVLAQALPIAIDGRFSDWTAAPVGYLDKTGDDTGIDLLRFTVSNDEQFLFIQLETAQEINLTENNNLALFLDTDHDAATGKSVNGIGAELEIRLGQRLVIFYKPVQPAFFFLNDVQFRHQPTVSSSIFEMVVGRAAKPDGIAPLFSGSSLRLVFRDGLAGDLMPDAGQTFSYIFDETPVPPYEPVPLLKENPAFLRLMTWNTLNNGLDDVLRTVYFRRIIALLQPDVVTFNECWDLTAAQVASFMNAAAPIGGSQSWQAVKLDQGNVTASRFPFLKNWLVYPGHRLTASLIDLPDAIYPKDLLVVNAHLKCCGDGDGIRQNEADALTAFLLDAKTSGGVIDLPQGTPFVLSGDLNLVGSRQPLTTLLEGTIVNTSAFGQGAPPDWDGTALEDALALQADKRMTYTWRKESSEYPPSRLDYHIFANSVMQMERAFTLQTEVMPPQRLALYGLSKNDTRSASDHLPKVTDFSVPALTSVVDQQEETLLLEVFPSPFDGELRVGFEAGRSGHVDLRLLDLQGRLVVEKQVEARAGRNLVSIRTEALPSGVYVLAALTDGRRGRVLVLKK